MNSKNKMIFVTILGCILLASVLFKIFNSAKKSKDTFVVGIAAGYAPFISINQNGEYEGFDIDVIEAVAEKINKKLILKDLGSMTPLFTALNQESIDAIIWGLSITQSRLKKVAMIHYQGEVTDSYPLIFWERIPDGIISLSDMKGKTVCVEPASSQDAVLSKYDFITKLSTEKVDDALLNIQYGKADAAFVEPAIAKKFKNKYPEIKILNIPLAKEDQVQGVGIVVKKDNKKVINNVEQSIALLKSEGIISELEQKWDME